MPKYYVKVKDKYGNVVYVEKATPVTSQKHAEEINLKPHRPYGFKKLFK